MPKTIVTSSGSGIAKIPDANQPIITVDTSLFLFDLTADSLAFLKTYLAANTSFKDFTVFQTQRYRDAAEFKANLTELVKYGIYTNQALCEHCYVITTKAEHTAVANEVWPAEQKPISKFIDKRKWPTADFAAEFIPIEGSGSVGPDRDKVGGIELISWSFELGYKEEMTTETYTYDPVTKTLPIALEDGVTLPALPTASGTVTSYSIIYYFWNEYTILPFVESHAKSMGGLTTAHDIGQNTITVHVQKQDHVEIIANVAPADSGGGN